MTQGSEHPSALGSWSGQRGKGGATASWAQASLVLDGQVPCPFRPASPLGLGASAQGPWTLCHPGVHISQGKIFTDSRECQGGWQRWMRNESVPFTGMGEGCQAQS